MKSETYWRSHVYTDITHVLNIVRGFLGAITTLNADDEMVLLVLMHCQSEDENNYRKMLHFFKTCIPVYPHCQNYVSQLMEIKELVQR